jgi:hypothetical protein
MKSFTLFIIIFLSLSAKAQLAIIRDTDGFVNVREKGNIKSRIIGRLNTNDITLYDGEDDNKEWRHIFYSPDNMLFFSSLNNNKHNIYKDYIDGFVYFNRVIPINSFSRMILKKDVGYISSSKLTGNVDTVIFILKTRLFSIKSHKIHRSKEGCINCTKAYVDKIDGKKPWGVDGDLPTKEIYNISLKINGKAITIPFESYNDIYQPRLENLNIYFDKKGNFYFYMPGNSDGAGGYDVVWVINNGKLIKRYVDGID